MCASYLGLQIFGVTSAKSDVDLIGRDGSRMFVSEINRKGQVSGRGRV